MRENYKKEFEEKDYPAIRSRFLAETTAYVTKHMAEIMEQGKIQLSEFMKTVARVQKLLPIPTGWIQVSLMHTSIYMGNPVIHMAAYTMLYQEGEEFAGIDLTVDWLFACWDKFREDMETAVKQRNAEQYITMEDIRLYQLREIDFLYLTLLSVYKYIYCDAEKLEGYSLMERQKEFQITVGYYDQPQTLLYREMPEIDIFQRQDDDVLIYGKFDNKIYQGKNFQEIELAHAKFINCEFRNCKFIGTDLSDVQFINCRFYDTKVMECILYGSYFSECVLKKTEFDGTQWFYEPRQGEPVKGCYRNVLLYDCELSQICFQDSNLKHVRIEGGSRIESQFNNCILEDSNIGEE